MTIRELQRQMEREALILGSRILRIYDTLEQLRRITSLLFRHTYEDPDAIDAWLEHEEFEVDSSGFFRSQRAVEQMQDGQVRADALSFGWAASRKDDPVLRFHLYALRELGKDIRSLREQIEGTAWTYYQDAHNACLVYPSMDIAAAIPCDFDWSTYHTYLAAGPEANPERLIRWTRPNVDYAGEGLILSASIPIYVGEFQGLWSIDVPVRFLLCDSFKQTLCAPSQMNFIADGDGNLLMHPVLETEVDREKGTIHHMTLADIGGDFGSLDTPRLLREGSGELLLRDGDGVRVQCAYQAIEAIGWVLFTTVPALPATGEPPLRSVPEVGSHLPYGRTLGAGPTPGLAALPEPSGALVSSFEERLLNTVLDGKYRVEEQLGSGGSGVVYRGTHLVLQRPVAIKVLRPFFGRNREEQLRRFQLEGISSCRVQHPNAVVVLDLGIASPGLPYLIMELLEGRTLADELRAEGMLPLGRTLDLAALIARVLAAVHAIGIVHRDIKPDNVFLHTVGTEEIVKILDFGIAKLVREYGADSPALTTTGQILGTPVYMAPEQATGARIEPRTDVYSLGILIYELLSGVPPFRHESGGVLSVVLQHVTAVPPALSAAVPGVPAALEHLVGRMLCKAAEDRPHADEVVGQLESIAREKAPYGR